MMALCQCCHKQLNPLRLVDSCVILEASYLLQRLLALKVY